MGYVDKANLRRLLAGLVDKFAAKTHTHSYAPTTAVTNISRSGTTFTATRADGNTFTFDQQDNNTTYPKAVKSITRSGTTFTATCYDNTTFTFTQQDNDTTYSAASQSVAGLMSAADKTKLDGIASGAQVNSVTGVKGNAESSYRSGNVNITPADIGAVSGVKGNAESTYRSGNVNITPANIGAQEVIPIQTITKTMTLTTSWQDTGIVMGNLTAGSGTYVVQVSGISASGTAIYSEIWSGVMSVYTGGTNSTDADEILLHKTGHATNSRQIYLRTLRVASNASSPKLQIATNQNWTASSSITFKFRKLI